MTRVGGGTVKINDEDEEEEDQFVVENILAVCLFWLRHEGQLIYNYVETLLKMGRAIC